MDDQRRKLMEQVDHDLNIPPKLKDIIDDDNDDLEPHFKEPEELLELFTVLEEKNLFLIQQTQDAE